MKSELSGAEKKAELRMEIRALQRAVSPERRAENSRAIVGELKKFIIREAYGKVGAFAADPGEPDLSELIAWLLADRRRVYLPRFRKRDSVYEMVEILSFPDDLSRGRYGIMEPVPELPAAAETDFEEGFLYLIPGVAFDAQGNRIGRGKGYYDRLLADFSGMKTGVFFQFQKLDAIPAQAHDRALDMAVTEQGMSFFTRKEQS